MQTLPSQEIRWALCFWPGLIITFKEEANVKFNHSSNEPTHPMKKCKCKAFFCNTSHIQTENKCTKRLSGYERGNHCHENMDIVIMLKSKRGPFMFFQRQQRAEWAKYHIQVMACLYPLNIQSLNAKWLGFLSECDCFRWACDSVLHGELPATNLCCIWHSSCEFLHCVFWGGLSCRQLAEICHKLCMGFCPRGKPGVTGGDLL